MKNYFESRPHPWHGLSVGKDPPYLINAYIEITPFDPIKYEVDKESGYLKVDRPQLYSALPPALYGFIPKTYCGERIGRLAGEGIMGDNDPLDICVISERPITKSEVIVPARVIGGIRLIDKGEADDKIIAVLESDSLWNNITEYDDLPIIMRERIHHYFLTYKQVPGQDTHHVKIESSYGKEEAFKVVQTAMKDYEESFST